MKYNMKYNNLLECVWGGLIITGLAILLETSLQGVGFLTLVFIPLFAPLIEEGLKVGGLIIFKPPAKLYYLTTALLFTLIELFGNYSGEMPLWWIGVRLVPHFLFAIVFLWGMRKSVIFGFVSALIVHILWNFLVITF